MILILILALILLSVVAGGGYYFFYLREEETSKSTPPMIQSQKSTSGGNEEDLGTNLGGNGEEDLGTNLGGNGEEDFFEKSEEITEQTPSPYEREIVARSCPEGMNDIEGTCYGKCPEGQSPLENDPSKCQTTTPYCSNDFTESSNGCIPKKISPIDVVSYQVDTSQLNTICGGPSFQYIGSGICARTSCPYSYMLPSGSKCYDCDYMPETHQRVIGWTFKSKDITKCVNAAGEERPARATDKPKQIAQGTCPDGYSRAIDYDGSSVFCIKCQTPYLPVNKDNQRFCYAKCPTGSKLIDYNNKMCSKISLTTDRLSQEKSCLGEEEVEEECYVPCRDKFVLKENQCVYSG